MGQAKNRGTFKQRKSAAIKRRARELEIASIESVKRKREESERYASLSPEQRAQERAQKKQLNEALLGYYSISLGMLGEYRIKVNRAHKD